MDMPDTYYLLSSIWLLYQMLKELYRWLNKKRRKPKKKKRKRRK